MGKFVWIFVLLELFLHGLHIKAAMDTDVDRLVNDLKRNYTVYARPPRNQSKVLEVSFGFSLLGIREFDERNEKFSVIGTIIASWEDDRLVWNPDEYGGTQTIVVDNNVFWTPTIFLTNNQDEIKRIGENSYWKVRYYYFGWAEFHPDGLFSSICSPDVEHFPWDEQKCLLDFGMSGYANDEVTLVPYDHTNDPYFQPLTNFLGDELWDVKERTYETVSNTIAVRYRLKRKPLLAVINILVPIVLMSSLSIFVFVIPAESGERISFGLTVLLALAVFLTLVSDGMPKSATSIATLSYYLIVVLAFNILTNILNILHLKLYFRGENKPVPKCLQTFARCLLCKGHKRKETRKPRNERHTRNHMKRDDVDNDRNGQVITYSEYISNKDRTNATMFYPDRASPYRIVNNGQTGRGPRSDQASSIYSEQRYGNSTVEESLDDQRAEDKITWHTVSAAFDLILFVFSAVVLISATVGFLVRARD